MKNEIARTLSEVPNIEAAILFGSTVRGDSSSGSDHDIALILNGEGQTGYLTSDVMYESLSLTPYDITFATIVELDGIISSFFKNPFAHHLSKGQIIVGNETIREKLINKACVWKLVQNSTSISSEYISDVAFMLNRSRREDHRIRRYVYQEQVLGLEDMTSSLKDRIKSCKTNLRAIMTSGLIIKRYNEPDFGKEDLISTFLSEYILRDSQFKFGNNILDFKEGAIKALFLDMISDKSYEAITRKVSFCRQLVESVAGSINDYIMALMG